MAASILATKLYIPPARTNVVLRPRLIARLNQGLQRKLTLISAPAGFGKTTLVSDWVNQKDKAGGRQDELGEAILRPASVAWVSLDEGDNDPTRFFAYFVAALQTLALSAVEGSGAKIGEAVMAMLQSPQPPLTETILTTLLNEISSRPDNVVLVLDDYHLVDAKPIDIALTFLLEHLPPQIHLVITTREDPHLPLARLRAQGQLTELRAADLRFTAVEAAEFLNQMMGLSLSVADIGALEDRTEGWIAGLQLAALALQGTLAMPGQQDIPGFIRAFAGDHRYIVDYLVEEVLQRQPAPIRSFLLQTAILDRLNGSLCEAVTGQPAGQAQLEALERGNFFVVPLDDKRHWYRYHHLFSAVLRAHLDAEQSDQVATLHRRASEWYARQGAVADAIRHALAAEDFVRAAEFIERAVPAMRQSRQEVVLLGWLAALPDDLISARPVLCVHYAGALLARGELKKVEDRLWAAERWLNAGSAVGMGAVVVDEAQFRQLPGLIAVFRAGMALALGDVINTVKYARLALELVPEDDTLGRGAATALLGLAYWASGDSEAAHQTYADGMARVQKAGYLSDVISGAIARADIRIAQGRLHEAMDIYEHALQLAVAQGEPLLRGTADVYVGMSELQCERNDLPAARQHLLSSQTLGERTGFPQNRSRWCVAMAGIREAEGDLADALDLLDEADRLYVSDFFPNVRPVAALRARVWVAQGRLGEALGWVRERGLFSEDDLSYLREFEHITLARVLLARAKGNPADHTIGVAIELLERLLHAAQAGKRMGSVIEILVLQAIAQHGLGDLSAALMPLQQALLLAEPEGYVRIFVDEGPPMAQLLTRLKAEGSGPQAYIHTLLAACGRHKEVQPSALSPQPLVEPLSQRELEVLRLFNTELSGPEIARELVVALSTIRTHTKGIYSKLNVNSRRAAVQRAAELGLI